jgi:hypothetical protein
MFTLLDWFRKEYSIRQLSASPKLLSSLYNFTAKTQRSAKHAKTVRTSEQNPNQSAAQPSSQKLIFSGELCGSWRLGGFSFPMTNGKFLFGCLLAVASD